MRFRYIAVCASLLALLAGCVTVPPAQAPVAESSSPAPSGTAERPPTEGPTDLPPTPSGLPPALEPVDPVVSGNNTGPVTDQATTDYVWAMIQNADRMWSKWFAGEGLKEPYVTVELVQPGKPYHFAPCWLPTSTGRIDTFPSDFPNAMYCNAVSPGARDAGIMILPIQSMAKLWTGNIYGRQVTNPQAIGDYAAGVVTAHEFGHHIEAELAAQKGLSRVTGKNKELIADCFAGVHAYSLSLGVDGHLDAGDIDEAVAALEALGDTSTTSTDPHGTPEERSNAFRIGLQGSVADPRPGVPNNCLKAFFPAAARTS